MKELEMLDNMRQPNNLAVPLHLQMTFTVKAMDAREDLPKVSIETEQDWRRIQQNLSAALLARLEIELETHGQSGDKDALLPHVNQVNKQCRMLLHMLNYSTSSFLRPFLTFLALICV